MFPTILRDIPADAFVFFLIDPNGWRIPLRTLEPLLARSHSEVIFNFMFDFINRAASMKDVVTMTRLDELIPFGGWRTKLEEAGRSGGERKAILVEAFACSLKRLGKFDYVAETTVLRPIKDRPLYCLFYATRHPKGIEVFRNCQINAMREESKTRATTKVKHATSASGQGEFFESLHDMAPDKLESFLRDQCIAAERALLELAPNSPHFINYENLRAQVLARHVVRLPDVNKIAARLYREKRILFPDWEHGKRVPQRAYRTQSGDAAG